MRAALGRYGGHRALQHLQKRLLHALAGNVPGNGDVFSLAGDLVDFVDVDDAPLGQVDVVIGVLNQPQQDVFHVLAHISGLRQTGGVADGEGHVQNLGQGLGQIRLAAARGAQHHDVGFLQFHVRLGGGLHVLDALVVVVYRHAQGLLGLVLAHYVLIQNFLDFLGTLDFHVPPLGYAVHVVGDDLLAEQHAFVADVGVGPGHDAAHLVLGLSAERTFHRLEIRFVCHESAPWCIAFTAAAR